MWHNIIMYFLSTLFFVATAMADGASVGSRTRVGGLAGYGLASVLIDDVGQEESPGAFSFFYEQVIDERRAFGVEHSRSLTVDGGVISTAISFTGFQGKWYPLTPIAQRLYGDARNYGTHMTQKNISPYLAAGFGFAQSSLRDKVGGQNSKGTVGVYLGGRVGIDMPVYKAIGAIAELNYGSTVVGEGQVDFFSLMIGLFLYL